MGTPTKGTFLGLCYICLSFLSRDGKKKNNIKLAYCSKYGLIEKKHGQVS